MSVSIAPAGPSIRTRVSDAAGIGRISGAFTGDMTGGGRSPRPGNLDAQTLDDASVLQMLGDDLVNVLLVDVGVPDGVGIDDHHRPLLAAVETSRLVDAHLARAGKLEALHAVLGVVAHLLRAAVGAALLAVGALVAAEEDMTLVVAHHRII